MNSKPGAKGDQAVLEPFEQSEPVHREAFRIFRDNVLQLLAPQQDILAKSEDIILQFPKRAGKASLHRVRVGSSAFVAPMGLFYPKLLAPLDWSAAERKPWFEAQDLMDDDYIADMLANRPGGTGSLQADDKLLLRDDQQFPPGDVPPGALPDMIRDAIAKVVALHEANKHADGEQRRENKSLEASQRLWGNIILTGGGAHIKGIVEALELRLNKMRPHDVDKMKALELRLNKMRPHDVDKMKVVTGPPNAVEGDHPHLSWSGGALVAAVESYKEFRVSREEWDQRGIGALRERVFFPW
ncbi:hypothetical protein T484DRAFT_1879556 [Baffinella frigidus]|nr:hypothetical protein T484DRAFT_1879556 [Cryptophyta sp. CCMP2293]